MTADGRNFTGPGAFRFDQLLATNGAHSAVRFVSDDPAHVDQSQQELRAAGKDVPNLNGYFRVSLRPGADSAAVSRALAQVPFVESAYPEPRPVRSPASPDLSSSQTYRSPPPLGLGAWVIAGWPGAAGSGVQVFDVEYSWNTSHEDLSALRAGDALVPLGTPVDPFNDNNHGTAVLGILAADSNGVGMTGMVGGIKLRMVNTYTTRMWNPAGAIYTAARNAGPGDVILVEQQSFGPSDDPSELMPIEWLPDVYDAIRLAVAKGIVVVEAGGNGGRNLDDPAYGATFPRGKANSGAIIVGAGAAGPACFDIQPSRSRLSFSNFGSRIDVQGWGECVATTGYGDAYDGGINARYTSSFSGTSSAAPMVATAAASYIGAYKALNGTVPSPQQVKADLIATGTPQSYLATYPGKIGPLVNVSWALKRTDLEPPSAPTNLRTYRNSSGKPVLNWYPGTDNVGIAGYAIYRDDVLIKRTSSVTTFTDEAASSTRSYKYRVHSVDRTDKFSAGSNTVTIPAVNASAL